ncbi:MULTISPECIES: hypothetical protein [unclassified Alteromonas]|jgi:myosin heavy subunit|uniref:hypothetical protein n=1 Tax=unclassified Alteromonas TaxID=2614992 RepID=UPI001EF2A51D|nr:MULTISPECIES: hypothetical protein [unclassified Alteromonas]MCG7638099.1 hypothetical protein [Alteromonas sp. CNT1-28]MCG7814981.1 hypothetical protein [Alteromonas sp. MCA-1]
MSGVKKSDVLSGVNSRKNTFSKELAKIKSLRKLPKSKIKKLQPKINRKLVEKYFPKQIKAIDDEQKRLVSDESELLVQANKLQSDVDSMSKEPKTLLGKLEDIQRKVANSQYSHYMDREYQELRQVGVKIDTWCSKVRNSVEQYDHAVRQLELVPETYEKLSAQLIELDEKAEKLEQQALIDEQLEDYQQGVSEQTKLYDSEFAAKASPELHKQFQKLQKNIMTTKKPNDAKQGLVELTAIVVQVSSIKQRLATKQKEQTQLLKNIQADFNDAKVEDPLLQESVHLEAFYETFNIKKVAELKKITSKINALMSSQNLFNINEVQVKIGTLRKDILKQLSSAQDDANKASEIIETALTIREKLLESGTVSGDQVNVFTDQILEKGLKIETLMPKGAFFEISPDGNLTSDVDPITGDCIGGMKDISDALAANGIPLVPKSYSLSEEGGFVSEASTENQRSNN